MENGLSDADHLALARLVVEAVWRVDHGRGATTHELFLDDAVVTFDGKVTMEGREQLEAWGEVRPTKCRHLASNLRFQADGPDRATGCGLEFTFVDPDTPDDELGTSFIEIVNEWNFHCVRTPEGWRFARIDLERLFRRPAEAGAMFDSNQHAKTRTPATDARTVDPTFIASRDLTNGLTDADHLALARLVGESLWRVDHGHGDTNHELYVADAVVTFDGNVVMEGLEQLEAWGQVRPEKIRHVAANLRFVADGPDRAKGTGVEFTFLDPDTPDDELGTSFPQLVVGWTFQCVRAPEGWRFARVDVERLFARPGQGGPFDINQHAKTRTPATDARTVGPTFIASRDLTNGLVDADHLALARLVVESLWRGDHGHGATTHELFTEDAEIAFDGKVVLSGREQLRAWGAVRPDRLRHIAGNLRFVADGPDRALGSGVEIAFLDAETPAGELGTSFPGLIGEWTFHCVRTPEGWRFTRIHVERLFVRPGEGGPFDINKHSKSG